MYVYLYTYICIYTSFHVSFSYSSFSPSPSLIFDLFQLLPELWPIYRCRHSLLSTTPIISLVNYVIRHNDSWKYDCKYNFATYEYSRSD